MKRRRYSGEQRFAQAPSLAASRRSFYSLVLDQVVASAGTAGALAGANFWAYAGAGRPAAQPPVPSNKTTGACVGPAPGVVRSISVPS